MSTEPMIGDAEKLRDAEQRIRDSIVALADWLTDRDDYDIPENALRALCPADVPDRVRERCFQSLLLAVSRRGADRTDLPFEGQVDLDYMTGARR
jgi:hypothetical protein